MSPLSDGCNYDIAIFSAEREPQTYRTLELLADSGAHILHGRGTRVWKAVLLKDGVPSGSPLVIKDVWVDPARPSEGSLFDTIRTAGRRVDASELWENGFLVA